MTVAVCTKCGAIKHGALTPCLKCHFDPKLNEDKAKAMVLTDHFLPKEELEKISERLQNGQPVTYPDDVVQGYISAFEENPDIGKVPTRLKTGCIIVLAAIIAVTAWLVMKAT